jgi:L,D-transpeptidase YcbB
MLFPDYFYDQPNPFQIPRMRSPSFQFLLYSLLIFVLSSCEEKKPEERVIVSKPELLDDNVKLQIRSVLSYAKENEGRISDSIKLQDVEVVSAAYEKLGASGLWCNDGQWLPLGDSVFSFIQGSQRYGLFPSDYHVRSLTGLRARIETDSLSSRDAAVWTRADLMMTDALIRICRDIKQGRLPKDTLTLDGDTALTQDYYISIVEKIRSTRQLALHLDTLQPRVRDYHELKSALSGFLDSAEFKRYTYLAYPPKDTAAFQTALQLRLFELDYLASPNADSDTATFRAALRKFQTDNKLKVTGRINESTVNKLNDTDWEKFKRIALTLDKYKKLPDTMPGNYVWVNIPGYYLKVVDSDTVALTSKVIVGTPKTRTPALQSEISNFITYPQWTVPYSIVFKEMLPQIQKNIDYLQKQNLMVVDRNDSIVDPATIDWSKLNKKNFPYQLRQRQGDDNSLGVLKFNFRNKYSVYLHDTNARWLFGKSSRALSHGCVRVQDWKKLANYLIRNDTIKHHPDTISNWIARQEKHTVYGFPKVPIFIRYISCEAKDGLVRFYDDVYSEDRILLERYFAKSIN